MPHLRVNVKVVARSHATNSPHAQRATRSFGREDKPRKVRELTPTAGKHAAGVSLYRRISQKRAEQYLEMKRNSIDGSAFCGAEEVQQFLKFKVPTPKQQHANPTKLLSVQTSNETTATVPVTMSQSSCSSYCSFDSHTTQSTAASPTVTAVSFNPLIHPTSSTLRTNVDPHRQYPQRSPSDSVSVHSPSVFSSSSTDAEGSGPASPDTRPVLSGFHRSGPSPKGHRANRVLCMKTICIPGAPDIRRRSYQDTGQKTDEV